VTVFGARIVCDGLPISCAGARSRIANQASAV
jgi:hypothetical protein